MKILSGHYSEETALVINDYPYGFRLRCKIRYWLEVNSKGTRFWSQTTNPKKPGEVWNKAKCSTYCLFGAMFQKEEEAGEENGHVGWTGLSMYDIKEKGKDWLATYHVGLTEGQVKELEAFIKLIEKHDAKKAPALVQTLDEGAGLAVSGEGVESYES